MIEGTVRHQTAAARPTTVLSATVLLAAAVAGIAVPSGPLLAEGPPVAPATAPAAELRALEWLVGHWRNDSGERSSEELWMAAEGGLMLGLSRTLAGGRAVGFEYLRIEQRGATVVYVASPGGRPPTEFPLRELSGQRVVFENPEHDFPQRILYWREGEGLCARIEGERDGQARQLGWCWSPR
jgi:hypothetical protein